MIRNRLSGSNWGIGEQAAVGLQTDLVVRFPVFFTGNQDEKSENLRMKKCICLAATKIDTRGSVRICVLV